MEKLYDMIVIGGGPGGYTAALYAVRAGLETLVFEKMSPGGQMALTEQLDNYPGFENGIEGYMLAMKMQAGAARFGVETRYADVQSVDLSSDIKKLQTTEGEFLAKTVVVATGANPRKMGVKGEDELYMFFFDMGIRGDENVIEDKRYSGAYSFDNVKDKIEWVEWMDNGEKLRFIQDEAMLSVNATGYPYGMATCVRVARAKIAK